MSNLSPDPIIQIATGYMAAKHLFVANEIGLFETLSKEPGTLPDLSARMGIPSRTLRMTVDAMVVLGFVERKGNSYQNSALADTFLSGKTPTDIRPFLKYFNQLSYPRWGKLEEAIRTDKPVFGQFNFNKEEQKIFSEGVEGFTSGPSKVLAATYNFSRHNRILDLGGGTGVFLLEILNHHPTVETTLFEFPQTAAVARDRVSQTSCSEKITIVEGDFFKDSIPGNHDAILLANIVHCLSPDRNLELFSLLRKRVPKNARLLLLDFWTDSTHTKPPFSALMAGEFLLNTGEGDVYSEEEVTQWLQNTGWKFIERNPIVGPTSLIVAETA